MSFEDFLENFERVEVCHIAPEPDTPLPGKEKGTFRRCYYFEGNWIRGVTDGGPLSGSCRCRLLS
jgi:hypothetical protein